VIESIDAYDRIESNGIEPNRSVESIDRSLVESIEPDRSNRSVPFASTNHR